MSIVEFLTARLDEEQAEAEGAAAVASSGDTPGMEWFANLAESNGDSIVAMYPVRALAEVAAKRAILALHVPRYGGSYCATCIDPDSGPPGDGEWFPCPTVSHLASVYAGHPNYDPAWTAA